MLVLWYRYCDKYVFNVGVYTLGDAIVLINRVKATERNCYVQNGCICLKSGKLPKFYAGVNFTKHVVTDGYDIIVSESVDAWFNNYHYKIDLQNTNMQKALKLIDNAVVIDNKLHTIQTPFGVCDATKLSTGLKCLLICLYAVNTKKTLFINVTECGLNVFDLIVKVAENKPITLYTTLYDKEYLSFDSEMNEKNIGWMVN